MSYIRLRVELAFPEPLAPILANNITQIRQAIRDLKSFARNINAGTELEENTTLAVYHRCYHDEDPERPCDPEQDI